MAWYNFLTIAGTSRNPELEKQKKGNSEEKNT